jgi:glycosyltransferase involved in cell wall biosynthesis
MNVLFVGSGNSVFGISTIVRSQGESLRDGKNFIDYYSIKGKGLWGYAKNILRLKKYLKNKEYDIIHAHYSLSAFTASLAGSKPLVVSLMGSDVKEKIWVKLLIKLFNSLFWDICIVKSEDMKTSSGIKNAYVIPNGVDLQKFRPLDKNEALEKLGWDLDKKHILFPANPERPEKNFKLAKEALKLLNKRDLELHYLNNVDNNLMAYFYNASDVVLLTSLWEGSPNVIKEAMACNCPVVSTKVGDVEWLFGKTEGCYITSFKPEAIADKLKVAIFYGRRTKGRERIIELGLDSETVAKRVLKLYNNIILKG